MKMLNNCQFDLNVQGKHISKGLTGARKSENSLNVFQKTQSHRNRITEVFVKIKT